MSLLSSRASAANDHFWALHEDPEYFAAEMLERKEHRQEIMMDTNGKGIISLQCPKKICSGTVFWEALHWMPCFSPNFGVSFASKLKTKHTSRKVCQSGVTGKGPVGGILKCNPQISLLFQSNGKGPLKLLQQCYSFATMAK